MYRLALLLVVSMISSQRVSYHNHKLYRLNITTIEQHRFLKKFSNDTLVKIRPPLSSGKRTVYAVVHPKAQSKFQSQLDEIKMQYEIRSNNIDKIFKKQRGIRSIIKEPHRNESMMFDKYYTFDEIQLRLHEIALNYSEQVRVAEIGMSSENRQILVVQIKQRAHGRRPVIFIDAGMDACEWIGPAFALFIIEKLLTGRDMSADVDWHILPVANPDGYVYSHEHDRLWCKTRSPQAEGCIGVGMRRNFDFKYAEVGESYPCDEDYWGPRAFSEPEAQSIATYLGIHQNTIKLYLSLHGHGEYLLYPWAFTKKLPADNDDLRELCDDVLKTILPETFPSGNYAHLFEPTGGSNLDFAKVRRKIKYCYALELLQEEEGFEAPYEIIETSFEYLSIIQLFGINIGFRFRH